MVKKPQYSVKKTKNVKSLLFIVMFVYAYIVLHGIRLPSFSKNRKSCTKSNHHMYVDCYFSQSLLFDWIKRDKRIPGKTHPPHSQNVKEKRQHIN